MVRVLARKEVTVTVSFNEHEARVLMSLIQNPPCDPDDEPNDSRQLREDLFKQLRDAVK